MFAELDLRRGVLEIFAEAQELVWLQRIGRQQKWEWQNMSHTAQPEPRDKKHWPSRGVFEKDQKGRLWWTPKTT